LLISPTQQNAPDLALSNASITIASHPDLLDACFNALTNNPPSSYISDFDEDLFESTLAQVKDLSTPG
jgi:hypothetical protein